MSRLAGRFQQLAQRGRKALIPTWWRGIQAGCHRAADAPHGGLRCRYNRAGGTFSDPMSEGPVLQLGHERALANGTTLRRVLELVRSFASVMPIPRVVDGLRQSGGTYGLCGVC